MKILYLLADYVVASGGKATPDAILERSKCNMIDISKLIEEYVELSITEKMVEDAVENTLDDFDISDMVEDAVSECISENDVAEYVRKEIQRYL